MMKNNVSITVKNVYTSIKQDILWMRLKPGEMFTEQKMADIYKTSKTPIREALAMLIQEDLIKVFPHKGYIVSEISFSDIYNLFQYRWVLENANIYFAVKYATDYQLDHLKTLANKLEPYQDETPNNSTFIKSNSDFHLYMAQMTGNPILLAQLVGVIERLQRVMWLSTTEEMVDLSIKEHYVLVDRIQNKKLEDAQSLMQKHINDVLEIGIRKTTKGLF